MSTDVSFIVGANDVAAVQMWDRQRREAARTAEAVERAAKRAEEEERRTVDRRRRAMEDFHREQRRLESEREQRHAALNRGFRATLRVSAVVFGAMTVAYRQHMQENADAAKSAEKLHATWKRTIGQLGNIVHESMVVEGITAVMSAGADMLRWWQEDVWGNTGGAAARKHAQIQAELAQRRAAASDLQTATAATKRATGDTLGAMDIEQQQELTREYRRMKAAGATEDEAQAVQKQIRARHAAERARVQAGIEEEARRNAPVVRSDDDALMRRMSENARYLSAMGRDEEARRVRLAIEMQDTRRTMKDQGFRQWEIDESISMLRRTDAAERQTQLDRESQALKRTRDEVMERWRIEDRLGDIQRLRAREMHTEAEAARILLDYEQRIAGVKSAEGVSEAEKAQRIAKLRADMDAEVEMSLGQSPSRSMSTGRFLSGGGLNLDGGTLRQVFSLPRPERDEREQLKRLVDTAVQIRDRIDSGVAAVAG